MLELEKREHYSLQAISRAKNAANPWLRNSQFKAALGKRRIHSGLRRLPASQPTGEPKSSREDVEAEREVEVARVG